MTRIVDGYFRLLKLFIALCLAVMVVLVFGNVVLRYAFNSGITVSQELSRWLFVWLTFVGAAVALRDHAHLGMDSLSHALPAWGKKACLIASNVLMLYCVYLSSAAAGRRQSSTSAIWRRRRVVAGLVLLQRRYFLFHHCGGTARGNLRQATTGNGGAQLIQVRESR